jgi:uncharacterized protein (DUF1499 family)
MTKKIKKARSPIDKLKPCPRRPNCVSSQSPGTSHYIEPLHYDVSRTTARKKLIKILKGTHRTNIVSDKQNYIHAECRTRFLRFVDDLEFLFDDDDSVIHVRSASRLGYSDLGVNRRRVEQLRQDFENELSRTKDKQKSGKSPKKKTA